MHRLRSLFISKLVYKRWEGWHFSNIQLRIFITLFKLNYSAADHLIICVYISLQEWWSVGRYCRNPDGRKQRAARRHKIKEQKSSKPKFCCLLTSRLVYKRCASEERSRPGAAEPSVASHFCSAAGDQRAGEMQGSNRLREKEEEEEGAGLREFARSLVYSVVLTSEWTPVDTGPCKCGGALNATDLHGSLIIDQASGSLACPHRRYILLCFIWCVTYLMFIRKFCL